MGERLTRTRLLAAAMGFAGVLIVARPDFGSLEPGVIAAAGSAVFFAATLLMTKTLTRGESIISILFWLTSMQFALGVATTIWDGQVTWPTLQTMHWLALIGAAEILAHLCLTTALSLAPASFVVPVDFARLPVIAGVGMVLYGERIDLLVLAGALVIFAGDRINIRSENRARTPQLPNTKS